MDLWRGHIGAAALFDWTQNPDVLALLASGTYWHYSQAGCVPRDGTTITTERLEKKYFENISDRHPVRFRHTTCEPHVRISTYLLHDLLGPAPDRRPVGPRSMDHGRWL